MAAFSEAYTITPRKCFAGDVKKDRMLSEKQIILVALIHFCFRILVSETKLFTFLYLKESLVITFTEKHCTKKMKFFEKKN